jgi:hypothetical protein
MADETSICNLALGRIGDERIMSLNDASQSARYCKLFYSQTRDEVLRSHAWNFATARTTLTALADPPAFGWDLQYQLPNDFLRLCQLNSWDAWEPLDLFELEGDKLLTNESKAEIKYIYRITDVSIFDTIFIEALSLKLASKIARPLTGSQSLGDGALQEYARVTGPLARKIDAMEGRPKTKDLWVHSGLVTSRMISPIG